MPLDRQSIEKRDFPIGRRGYEPSAVDAHLARLADEMDALSRQVRRRATGDSLASAASDQVRAIVEAAEASAAEIERAAEAEARQIRDDAAADAERTRADAIERARGHVGRVEEATQQMLQRVDTMEAELGTLVEALRAGAGRLTGELRALEENMAELYGGAGGRPGAEPAMEDVAELEHFEDEAAQAGPAPAADGSARDASPEADAEDDVEGARLIALNMALNGQPRADTDRYLAENFDLPDREGLLDEVYSSVGAE